MPCLTPFSFDGSYRLRFSTSYSLLSLTTSMSFSARIVRERLTAHFSLTVFCNRYANVTSSVLCVPVAMHMLVPQYMPTNLVVFVWLDFNLLDKHVLVTFLCVSLYLRMLWYWYCALSIIDITWLLDFASTSTQGLVTGLYYIYLQSWPMQFRKITLD